MPPNKFHADVLEMGDELEKAEFALQARRYDLAIQLMRKELIAHPENAVAFYTIARAYMFKVFITQRSTRSVNRYAWTPM